MDSVPKRRKLRLSSREIIAGTAPTPPHLLPPCGEPLEGVDVILAPLCGLTDAVFRGICFEHGADMAVTEMVSSEGVVRNSPHVRSIRHLDMTGGPLSLQIFGADPEMMGEAAAILSELEPRFIDMNFGCPVRKIVNKNGGSAVLKDRGLLGRICKRVVDASRVPVSAKIRSGWDDAASEVVQDLARVIQDAGVSAITVHARTREQAFKGKADWLLIEAVKDAVSIPIVGNGDVTDAGSYSRMKAVTGCDAVMIGRAAIGNPWIFGEIKALIEKRDYVPPTHRERVEGLLHHVRLAVERYGEPLGMISTRRIMAAYLKHFPNAREIRPKIMTCKRYDSLKEMMEEYLERLDPGMLSVA